MYELIILKFELSVNYDCLFFNDGKLIRFVHFIRSISNLFKSNAEKYYNSSINRSFIAV